MMREDTTLLSNVPYSLFWHPWRPRKAFSPSLSLSLPPTPFLSTAGSCEDLRTDPQYSNVRLVFIFIVFGMGTPAFGSFEHAENEWVGSFRELPCRLFPHFRTTSIVFGALWNGGWAMGRHEIPPPSKEHPGYLFCDQFCWVVMMESWDDRI